MGTRQQQHLQLCLTRCFVQQPATSNQQPATSKQQQAAAAETYNLCLTNCNVSAAAAALTTCASQTATYTYIRIRIRISSSSSSSSSSGSSGIDGVKGLPHRDRAVQQPRHAPARTMLKRWRDLGQLLLRTGVTTVWWLLGH